MTTLFYMYFTAREWGARTWDRIKDMLTPQQEQVQYTPGRHRMPIIHHGADETYVAELTEAREALSTSAEIWLDEEAMELHEQLNRIQRASLSQFNERFHQILADFEYDSTIDHNKNPMAPAARAEMIPWREEIADQFRSLTDRVQRECRKEFAA